MKKYKVAAGLLLCLILCAFVGKSVFATGTGVSNITSSGIKEKEDQINKAKDEKKQLNSSLKDLKEIKKELEEQKSDLKKYVASLDQNLSQIEQEIAELKRKITVKEEEIEETGKELESARQTEDLQKDSMITRIRMMYEKKASYLSDIFMKSRGFGEMINKADFMENVMDYDKEQFVAFQQNRQYIELCEEALELEKEILEEAKASVESRQNDLELLIWQKQQDITAYETDINNKEKAIKEYEAEIAAQDAEIKMLEAAIAEERRKIIESNGVVLKYDGGVFKFPLASYTRISDDYGMRIHPTLKVEKFHNGVDFAAPKGTAIYAAYDGVVVAAAYNVTMGNYVMIDHGDDLFTIYMHASKLYVKKDDVVVRGDSIAAVGTTGRSTGNHLHFGVRKDGEYVSPWNYLSE